MKDQYKVDSNVLMVLFMANDKIDGVTKLTETLLYTNTDLTSASIKSVGETNLNLLFILPCCQSLKSKDADRSKLCGAVSLMFRLTL